MLIAQEKRRTNRAEYILYMWQVEDMIRACNFDIDVLDKVVISKYNRLKEKQQEIRDWYDNLIEMMKNDKVEEKGHIQILKNDVRELNDFHLFLLHKEKNVRYQELFNLAAGNIVEFRIKSKASEDITDVEVCLTALYGVLMLKLQKKELSKDTLSAISTFSRMIAYLSAGYRDFEMLNTER